jgi:Asp-tRNA(Asn)/Glu-tRNA(Gln) amidotransferase A subunit family amidase
MASPPSHSPPSSPSAVGPDRRTVLRALAGVGVGTAIFQRALAAQVASTSSITPEMIQKAEWISGIELTDEQREQTARSMVNLTASFERLREIPLDYTHAPAWTFYPDGIQECSLDQMPRAVQARHSAQAGRPPQDDDLAFLPVTELSALLRARQISSVELTRCYLNRLEAYHPQLECVVTLTDELAMRQAERADRELVAGRYRGPLHGIPWGAKDLIAYPGYPTTWGAEPYREQTLDVKATVAQRLDDAGAVLVAKLSLGALAWGDNWFGGMTRNPWNIQEGSSGSSAGSAAATAAGLVGFSLGSETMGSIVSPSRRCGATGLRPTFGRVSRHGCMPLAWTMDKIGPITRSVEDAALVLAAIHGRDDLDPSAINRSFHWPPRIDFRALRIGYVTGEQAPANPEDVARLRDLGAQLVPIELPKRYRASDLAFILSVEAACMFDDLVRRKVTDGLNRWPGTFHQGELVPAVEYVRASRVRSLIMRDMRELFRDIDLYVGGDDLAITNHTGHPTIVVPSGLEEREGVTVPRVTTMTGRLFGEESLLAVADAFQQSLEAPLFRPPLNLDNSRDAG